VRNVPLGSYKTTKVRTNIRYIYTNGTTIRWVQCQIWCTNHGTAARDSPLVGVHACIMARFDCVDHACVGRDPGRRKI
jgi:hypothetical protein